MSESGNTSKFIGCILSIRTKPCALGQVQNIIGTVRDIDVDQQAIVLDEPISNGNILPDGFALLSSEIADLTVIGKASSSEAEPVAVEQQEMTSSDSSDSEPIKTQKRLRVKGKSSHKIAKPKPRKATPLVQYNAIESESVSMATSESNAGLSILQSLISKIDIKENIYDDKKLGVLSQFLKPISANPQNVQQRGNPQQQKKAKVNEETFEMSKSEMTNDFDFEQSNAQFNKLPVSVGSGPSRLLVKKSDPEFTSLDTTHLADRVVSSIKVKGQKTNAKKFQTDTGVCVPPIDLPTRSTILNQAHDLGLNHTRMIESMARAVVQTALPLFGDAYRLSPERSPNERPCVLIAAGPHWQGAVGIGVGRILATLGVRTVVYSPKEELTVCAIEEKLYKLTGQLFTRKSDELPPWGYELLVLGLDDHLTRSLTLLPPKLETRAPRMYIDPPLVESYGSNSSRCIIVSPCLPLAYNYETNLKFFIVNLGIPKHIFTLNHVKYVSPFADKLAIQLFLK